LWCASKLLGDEDGIDDDEDYFGLAPKRKRETAAGSELELVGNFLGNASNTIQQQDDVRSPSSPTHPAPSPLTFCYPLALASEIVGS
jgi:hypothetical protein